MKFTKQFLSFEEQADKLLARGLVSDKNSLVRQLQSVSYYRLSGYCYPFKKNDPSGAKSKLDDFVPGTTADQIWDRYVFDRKLRLLVMDALERIEIDSRTQLAYLHAEQFGAFGYADDPASLPNLTLKDRSRLLEDLRYQHLNSREQFVEHFRLKYGDNHNDLPIWVACEIMTFGNLLSFYRGCHATIQKRLAARYLVHETVCETWLRTLNTIRNICAHHSRLWNRVLGLKPKIPARDPKWHLSKADQRPISNNRVFAVLAICRHCLEIIAPDSGWRERLKDLLASHPSIPLSSMGFMEGWEEHPLWK